jgi:hypothetical protein
MSEREDYPEDVKARMANLVSESQIRGDVKNIQTNDKNNIFRARNSVVKKARYKRSQNG